MKKRENSILHNIYYRDDIKSRNSSQLELLIQFLFYFTSWYIPTHCDRRSRDALNNICKLKKILNAGLPLVGVGCQIAQSVTWKFMNI